MSVKECHRLVGSLADSLEDLKIQIDDNHGTWTVEILKAMLEKDNETKDFIQLAQSLLRLLDIDACESNGMESLDSWSQLLSTFPPDTPLMSLFQENRENSSDKSIVTDESKLEYLHVLATTLQQRRLKQLKKDKETQHTDNPDYPLNLLSGQASAEQKSLLLEGYAYLKDDYEQRRKGMRQRFKVLLETEGSGRKVLDTVSPHPPRQLSPKEDLSWLVQRFISPNSTHAGASSNPSAPKQSGNNLPSTETAVDRGGRVDDDESRYTMPEWQSAGGHTPESSQPQNTGSDPQKSIGRKEKDGPVTPGRQSNSKGSGRQQSNEQKDEAKAREGKSKSSQPQNKISDPKGSTGRMEKQGPGAPGRQSNSKGSGSGRQQSNEHKDEAKTREGKPKSSQPQNKSSDPTKSTKQMEQHGSDAPGRQSNGKGSGRHQSNEQKDEAKSLEGESKSSQPQNKSSDPKKSTGRMEKQGQGAPGRQSNSKGSGRQQSNEERDEVKAREGKSKSSQPQNKSSDPTKSTGRMEKEGPGAPGRQSNSKGSGQQQSNEEEDGSKAREGKTKSSQPQKKSSDPKESTGRMEKQGPGTPGHQTNSNSKGSGGQQSNEQKDEAKAREGDNEEARDKDEPKKNNRRGGGNRRRGRGGGRGRGTASHDAT